MAATSTRASSVQYTRHTHIILPKYDNTLPGTEETRRAEGENATTSPTTITKAASPASSAPHLPIAGASNYINLLSLQMQSVYPADLRLDPRCPVFAHPRTNSRIYFTSTEFAFTSSFTAVPAQ